MCCGNHPWDMEWPAKRTSPRYFCTNSEPTTRMKAAVVWCATALASMVLPVPGGPHSRTPRGGSMPICLYSSCCVSGSSTASRISCFWMSLPPMSCMRMCLSTSKESTCLSFNLLLLNVVATDALHAHAHKHQWEERRLPLKPIAVGTCHSLGMRLHKWACKR